MMGSPLSSLLASVIQVTNGFFFAEMPIEFSRPIYPEASVLMASKATNTNPYRVSLPPDSVSYTIGLGASFMGGLRVEHKAFTDWTMRHENLLWLSEVAGERYACWSTAIGPYEPIDGIDSDLASENVQFISDRKKKSAIEALVATTNALLQMETSASDCAVAAEGSASNVWKCARYMNSVKDLAAVYTYYAGAEAYDTNRYARMVLAAPEVSRVMGIAEDVSNAVCVALSITNDVARFARESGSADVVSNMTRFVMEGHSAFSRATNAVWLISAATNNSYMVDPYLTTTNVSDRAVAINLASAAESEFESAFMDLSDCAQSLSLMRDSAHSMFTNIHGSAFGINGKYVRAPAYFSSRDSTSRLHDVITASSNMFQHIDISAFMDSNGSPIEFDALAEYEHDSAMDYLVESGIVSRVGIEIPPKPSVGDPFSSAVFTSSAEKLSEVRSAAIFLPIERLANLSVTEGKIIEVSYTEERNNANSVGSTPFQGDVPPSASIVQRYDAGGGGSLYCYALTNGTIYALETNYVSDISMITPMNPASYRDMNLRASSSELQYTTWSMTAYREPFCSLLNSDATHYDPSTQMTYYDSYFVVNKSDYVTIDTPDMGLPDARFMAFTFDSLTLGKPVRVKTICCATRPVFQGGAVADGYFFRTNAYEISVSRATDLRGQIPIDENSDITSFMTLVADVEYDYSVSYSGWEDWDSQGGQATRHIQGHGVRSFVPIPIPTVAPDEGESRFSFGLTNVFYEVKDRLQYLICSKINANFGDHHRATACPPYMSGTTGGGYYTGRFPAERSVLLSMKISNLFVAANLNFTQGTTNYIGGAYDVYHVPGYRHLQTPGVPPVGGGDGWVGPFVGDGEVNAAVSFFRERYVELLTSQTNSVPASFIENVHQYENTRIPNAVEFLEAR